MKEKAEYTGGWWTELTRSGLEAKWMIDDWLKKRIDWILYLVPPGGRMLNQLYLVSLMLNREMEVMQIEGYRIMPDNGSA